MRNLFIALLLTVICYLLSVTTVSAVYDPTSVPNNKFGIHILFTSELAQAAELVNSGGGAWGYVTIPIRSDDRNLIKWQTFLDQAKSLKVIPIFRLATFPDGPVWTKPTIYDPIDWANFLDSLDWPTKNRYILVYNEPNRADEWGGQIDPADYVQQLSWTIDELKKRSDKFFVLAAGLDASVPDSASSMDEYGFLAAMNANQPGIFSKIDGWSSHSYPNPAYSSSPSYDGKNGIRSYQWELNFLQNYFGVYGLKVFITETGWDISRLGEQKVSDFFRTSFNQVWNNDYIIGITPFLLSAQQGDFTKFSWISQNQTPNLVYISVQSLKKVAGQPKEEPSPVKAFVLTSHEAETNWSAQKTNFWHKTTKEWVKNIISWFLK